MTKIYLLITFLLNISYIYSIKLNDNDFFNSEIRNLVRKIHRFSSNEKNEKFMNILLERLKPYILTHELDKERPEAPKIKYYNISDVRENFFVDEDGTYDINSYESVQFDRGYQVSFEREYMDYSKEDLANISYHMSLISDNHIYLGVYDASPEFSFYFQDYDLANVIGILFNQKSIWDWSIEEEIPNKYLKEFDDL